MDEQRKPIPLIPTGLRDKLPKGLSHPVGAEIISGLLDGCPRFDELWIAFGSKPLPIHPAPSGLTAFQLAFAVVCNNPSGGWYLSVPAVPSRVRSMVRRMLISEGLPRVLTWLQQSRYQTWNEGF